MAATITKLTETWQAEQKGEVRLFHTSQDLSCREDSELFFDRRKKHTSIAQCADCPFLGRCGYNAVAMGATHDIWGGIILPGDYPLRLRSLPSASPTPTGPSVRNIPGDEPASASTTDH
jgi:Transcription factor WhiB